MDYDNREEEARREMQAEEQPTIRKFLEWLREEYSGYNILPEDVEGIMDDYSNHLQKQESLDFTK